MLMMRKRLACCTRERKFSIDHDEQERIMTYNGLESCMLNNQSYEDESRTSRGDECITDSFDDDNSSSSSSKDAFGSFSSKCLTMKRDDKGLEEWELSESPQHFCVKEKPYAIQHSDIEAMKDKFSKLLLGEDVTGGTKGLSTALALSNAITNLAVTVFGELWKLEPLSEERKRKWQREMDWLLSPTNYMVELVPAKQSSSNGGIFEIMTPKARADIHMNLPALQKLDSMLIETLDLMMNTEFWYAEGGSQAEGRRDTNSQHSKRWWLPSPQVPKTGLSDTERKRLLHQGRVVRQVFKAAKAINESVLLEMPVPSIIKDALAKSGKANLGQELHKVLMAESSSGEDMLKYLNLKSEHLVLETVNRLEAAIFSWKERIAEQVSGKSPVRSSWSPFVKDPMSEVDKLELLLGRAETLLQLIKIRYPNLPQTFLDATKVQYGKDIGHSILEAYSRVLGNLAFSIVSRIGDVLQEDSLSNPNSPVAINCSPEINLSQTWVVGSHIRQSLLDKINKADGQYCDSSCYTSDLELSSIDTKSSSVIVTPNRSTVWCISREACKSVSPQNSP